jgi:hypothetical protein
MSGGVMAIYKTNILFEKYSRGERAVLDSATEARPVKAFLLDKFDKSTRLKAYTLHLGPSIYSAEKYEEQR